MFRRILKSTIAFILAITLMEGLAQAVKIFVLPPKWYKLDTTHRLDPNWPAGKTIDYADVVRGRGARLGKLSVNSLGFRGPERKLGDERKPGRLRVYCLGSSTTFGWGASTDSATYPAQLELCLKALLANESVEVINAGIPGNGSHDELGILQEDLVVLQPDVVVICSGWPDWTHYVTPETAPPSRETGLIAALKRSGSFSCAEYFRDQFIPRPSPPSEEELARRVGMDHFRNDVLDLFSNNLSEMIQCCKKQGATPLVVGMASPFRAELSQWSPRVRSQSASRLYVLSKATHENLRQGVLDFDRAFSQVCKNCEAAFIGSELLPKDPRYFFDGVHMTDEGYAAFAQALAPIVADAVKAREHAQ
jgi:lysophospholipase L1-like esterase